MEYKRLNTLIKSLDKTKRMAMSMYQENSETEFHRHYLDLAMQMEKLTNQTRIATVMDADIDRRHYIATAKDELNITVRDLNGRIGISMPYLLPKNRSVDSESYIIEPLVCALQGYIEKHRSDDDARGVVVTITEAGKKLRDKMVKVPNAMGGCVALSVEEAGELYTLLYKILNHFDEIDAE